MLSMKQSTLSTLLWQTHQSALWQVVILNLINALVNVGVLAFIHHYLFDAHFVMADLWWFFGLIALLLLTTFLSQYALTVLGHCFMFGLKTTLIERLLHTNHQILMQIGTPKILASLSNDIQSITMAFVRLPELAQGLIVCAVVMVYLGSLSLGLLVAVSIWVGITLWLSKVLVHRVYAHLTTLRHIDDELYGDYQAVLDGHQGLTLNKARARRLHLDFMNKASTYQKHIIKADTYHLSAVNFSNISLFGSLGLVMGLTYWLDLPFEVGITFGFAILFLQSPLLKAVGAYPVWQTAKVAFDKINALQLPTTTQSLPQRPPTHWRQIVLHDVSYGYDDGHFALKQVNLTLNRGETLFLIGANGSGKSTLANVLLGFATPQTGTIYIDDTPIHADDMRDYQGLFSAIFVDFYLFDALLGKEDELVDESWYQAWLHRLQLDDKVEIVDGIIKNNHLSTGQKKRLALLIAICEQRDILLLDEWAGEQDPHYRHYFYQTILPILQAMGKTLFVISHDNAYFDQADRLFEMRGGVLKELVGDDRVQASQGAVAHLSDE